MSLNFRNLNLRDVAVELASDGVGLWAMQKFSGDLVKSLKIESANLQYLVQLAVLAVARYFAEMVIRPIVVGVLG